MLVQGKTIAVTGAGKGIGWACVKFFLEQGANVTALTRSKEDVLNLQRTFKGRNFLVFQGDVTVRNDLDALLNLGCEKFGRVHGLVNNAGIRQRKKFFEITEEDWENVISSNLTSCFYSIQIFGKHMVEQGGGSIVNISSVAGMLGLPDLSGYVSSKAGLIGLTKALATELAPQNVRVNVLCPAFIETSFAEDFKVKRPELYHHTIERTPMARWGKPSEVAPLIAFLVSDFSGYITGGVYPVDGGWAAC
ncbi:MAG: SDR family NAD(P)-dependent oxidoreductase [Nitrospinaceae bacterium]|jgi:NAD(P)-dependent dehydrogenase (short-subunit alcohol dehydrogenase family)|nr:SDR family NAD(P)-dependent oxidoreductase [Nitrospinaceae bacterium]|tara:strand:- start:1323 stop:2069 length:747 start_codon:yes stop_codon:yes gene_type:complete